MAKHVEPIVADWRTGVQIPPAPPNKQTPTVRGWGFFLPDRAGSRVFAGIPAEACGLRRPALGPVQDHLPLSPRHFSLRPRSPGHARSPQRPRTQRIQIKELRADESSGLIAASAGKGNYARCVLSVIIDNYRRSATLWRHGQFTPEHSGTCRPARPYSST